MKDVTERFGENSKEAEKWQAELNRAQAKLVNLQTELQNNDQGLDKNGKAFDKDAQKAQNFGSELTALDKIQQSTTFQALNTALGNVEGMFKSVLSKGKEFSSFIWGMASDASTWADDLATESTKLGVSVETLQGWMEASQLVDTEVSAIKSAIVKLVNPTDKVSQTLKDLNVSTRQSMEWWKTSEGDTAEMVRERIQQSLQMRPAIDILWDAVDALSRETDAEKRNAAANELFGKSYMDMIPLIEQGKASWDAYVQDAEESGRVLSEEQVGKLLTYQFNLVFLATM